MKKLIFIGLLFINILHAANIVLNKETYTNQEKVVVNFTDMIAKNQDWVGIYPKDSSTEWKNVVKWAWTDDVSNGEITFDALAVGEYEVRAFYNNSYKVEAKKTFVVEAVLIDNVKPVIALVGNLEINVTVGTIYKDEGATASDNMDGDLSHSIVIINPVNTNVVDEYLVRYNVKDNNNNQALEVIRVVNVIDKEVPKNEIPKLLNEEKETYLDAINTARATVQDCGDKGVFPASPPVAWSEQLYSAAYEHSQDMAVSGVFTHEGSGTESDWTEEQGLIKKVQL